MAITQRRLTLEEFLKLPEEKPYLELIDGVVRQKVAPPMAPRAPSATAGGGDQPACVAAEAGGGFHRDPRGVRS
jgi:hypothetical protein